MGALAAAGIQAGASVIGGILGRNKAPTAGDTQRHTRAGVLGQAQGAREASEAYGFNPVTLLGVSSPMMAPQGDNSMMGQGIANAGLAMAEGMNEASAQRAYLQKLEEQNKELRKALDGQTLRPKVPGIFGQRVPQAGVAETVSVAPTTGVRMVGDDDQGYAPAGVAADSYPLRHPEVMTVKNLPLVADVELPGGKMIPVLHDGDEMMGIEKLPMLAAGVFYDHFTGVGTTLRQKADRGRITDPVKLYTPPVVLDAILPERYDPEYWIKRSADRKSWSSGYKRKKSGLPSGMFELGF